MSCYRSIAGGRLGTSLRKKISFGVTRKKKGGGDGGRSSRFTVNKSGVVMCGPQPKTSRSNVQGPLLECRVNVPSV